MAETLHSGIEQIQSSRGGVGILVIPSRYVV